MNSDKLNDYINAHPRESLSLVFIGICLLWQSVAAILGLTIYVIFIKRLEVSRWVILSVGIMLALAAIYFGINSSYQEIPLFIKQGFHLNYYSWRLLSQNRQEAFFRFIWNDEFLYILGFPCLIAGVLSILDLINNNPHEKMMKALQKGTLTDGVIEIKEKAVIKALSNLSEDKYDGTVLGVSKYSGKAVVIPDHHINQVVLVLGTTGAGKTITLRRFYQRAIHKGYPLIIVDGKPEDKNIEWLMAFAKDHGKTFYGFNCGNQLNYDPLAHGGYTELKDKIICLKDKWENDYYRSIAEDYLQTTFEILLRSGESFDLKRVVQCLTHAELVKLVHAAQDKELMDRVNNLKGYERKDITGLQAHLNILIHSELGRFFEKNDSTFSLLNVIDQDAVVYFALPALRFPSFSQVLGKLVINDIKAVIDRQKQIKPVFTVFDEFSVFAGEQVLNLVNMGRGKGVHAIFGTQGLADLERVDVSFKNQVLNCANSLICHRLNDQESAESVTSWIGTEDAFNVTAQLNPKEVGAGMGSVRRDKEFIVHPDAIKQRLGVGEAFYVTKVDGFRREKVRVVLI